MARPAPASDQRAGWHDLERLARLLAVRIPLGRALDTLARQSRAPRQRQRWQAIARAVQVGEPLGTVLARHRVGDAVLHRLVTAAEATGQLGATVQRVAQQRLAQERLRQQLQQTAAYPLTVGTIAVVLVTALVAVIGPQFATLYHQIPQLQGRPLPFLTRQLLALPQQAPLWLGGLGMLVAGLALSLRLPGRLFAVWRRRWAQGLEHLPGWGRSQRLYHLTHALHTLGAALGAGVTLPEALRLANPSAWEPLAQAVAGGQPLSHAYGQMPEAEPLVQSLLEVGEWTHSLPERCAEAAQLMEEELQDRTRALRTWLEPALLLGLTLVVGTLVLAVFLPVIQILQQAVPGR